MTDQHAEVASSIARLESLARKIRGNSSSQVTGCSCCSHGKPVLSMHATSQRKPRSDFLAYDDREAAQYIARFGPMWGEDLALRCYTSNLIGKQSTLVLHGGGNTSVKFQTTHKVFGHKVSVLAVKGSGYGLDVIPPEGFPQLEQDHLLKLVKQPVLTDVQMVKELRLHMMDPASPNPSVETLLHALLPAKFVDHSHADDIVALGNLPEDRARTFIKDAFRGSGLRVGVVTYVMPGFGLARHVARVFREDPSVNCLVLLNHGLFTWGDSARQSYDNHILSVSLSRRFAAKFPALALVPRPLAPPAMAAMASRPEFLAHVLCTLRGLYSAASGRSWFLRHRPSAPVLAFVNSAQCAALCSVGPITPDHVIRTKGLPLFVQWPSTGTLFSGTAEEQDSDRHTQLRAFLHGRLEEYAAAYGSYFQRHNARTGGDKVELDRLPRVILIEGIGLITAGTSFKAVEIAADIYEHTVPTILTTRRMGDYCPVSEAHLFDCEYWELEQRKLRLKKTGQPGALAGQVAVISGGCSGIGLATAELFAASGAAVSVLDIRPERVLAAVQRIRSLPNSSGAVVGHVLDVTDEAAVTAALHATVAAFGGIDTIVSNAGVVVQAKPGMASCSRELLEKSMSVNFFAHQWLTAAAVRLMLVQGSGGCLLYNISKAPLNPGPQLGPYCIAKAASLALMRQYAVEYGQYGIRANAVNPDRVRTNLFDIKLVEQRAQSRGLTASQYFASNLLQSEVLAEDVAKAFLHLALSTKTSCAILQVDGGNIAAAPR